MWLQVSLPKKGGLHHTSGPRPVPAQSSSREITTSLPRPTEEEGSTTLRGALRRCSDALLSSLLASSSSLPAKTNEDGLTRHATATQLRSWVGGTVVGGGVCGVVGRVACG